MEMRNNKLLGKADRLTFTQYLICLLAAFIPLLLMSKCSPFYPFNDWYDINQIFTVGKGIVFGKVPYVHLDDQKGPYAYLICMIGYLISHRSFLGVFVLEVVNLFFFSVFTEKSIRLFVKESKFSSLLIPVICTIIVSSSGFQHGGSMEEFSLGILAYALYSFLRILKEPQKNNTWMYLINGILFGFVFWTKFSMTGLFFVWFIVACFFINKYIFKNIALFLGGFCLSTLPLIIYFGANHALIAWLNSYIYRNVFIYGRGEKRSILTLLLQDIGCLKDFLTQKGNWGILIFLAMGAILIFLPKSISKASVKGKISVVAMFIISFLGVYAGGFDFGYYGMVLCVYLVFGAVAFLEISGMVMRKIKPGKIKEIVTISLLLLVDIFVVFVGFRISDNTYMFKRNKEELPQYIFAKRIMEEPEGSRVLLNYGFLDCGVYTLLDQVPEMKYFASNNREYTAVLEEQKNYLRQGIPDFVVTFYETVADDETVESVLSEFDNYERLMSYPYYIEGGERTYSLWKKTQ